MVRGPVRRRLIVDLPADDIGIITIVLHHVADKSLCVEPVRRTIGVHILPHPVADRCSAQRPRQDLRVFVIHPRRNRIRRRSHNHLDPRLAHCIYNAVHPRVLKLSVLRLPQAPGGLPHPHHCQPCLFHQRDIFIQPLIGHVFVVIRCAVKHIRHSPRMRLFTRTDRARLGRLRSRTLNTTGQHQAAAHHRTNKT